LFVSDQLLGLIEVIVGKVILLDKLLGKTSGGIKPGAEVNKTLADRFECARDGVAGRCEKLTNDKRGELALALR